MAHTQAKTFKSYGRLLVSLFITLLIGLSGCTNKSSYEEVGKYKDYSNEQLLSLTKSNDLEAITQLGRNALQSGDSIEAYKWFMKAAEQGYAVAEYNIGVCYLEGLGVKRNTADAFNWTMKAAKQGFAPAQNNIGLLFFSGEGVEEDLAEGFKWCMKAAKQGDSQGQFNVGRFYGNGIGTSKNSTEAFKWLMKSAEQNNPDAQNLIGDCFDHGLYGVNKNPAEAFNWYLKAAIQGNSNAQHSLASHYARGVGIDKNQAEAFKWFKKAAEQGDVAAQYEVGMRYYTGNGITKNNTEAHKWFLECAKQGNGWAQYRVGTHYLYGIGTTKDPDEGYIWLKRAADNGQQDAKNKIRNFKTGDEILAQERKDASKWKYEKKSNAMTDQVGYTATLLSNESYNGAKLELAIAYVNDGKPSMVAMCFNPTDVINFKTNDPNEIFTIKYRFDGGNVVTQECMMRDSYVMILEHSATVHNAQRYSGKWTKNLLNSDKLAIELETTRGKRIYTFDTQGLEWNHSYQK